MKKIVCSLLIMFILFSEVTVCFGATDEVLLANDVEVKEENIDNNNLKENETKLVNEIKDEEKVENIVENDENTSNLDVSKDYSKIDKDTNDIEFEDDKNGQLFNKEESENNKIFYNDEENNVQNDVNENFVTQSNQIQNTNESGKRLVEIDGVWRMVINGEIIYDYTGIGQNENGMWYMEKGDISYTYNNTWYEEDDAYIIENSRVQVVVKKDMTGLIEINKDNWRMVVNGKIIYDYTGLGENEYGIWYLEKGNISYAYNGTYTDKDGNVYAIEKSKVIGTRLVEIDGTWRMVADGKIDYDYTGIGKNENGMWYIEKGDISYTYNNTWYEGDNAYIIENSRVQAIVKKDMTGLIEINKDNWKMVVDGKIVYDYTGIGQNKNGKWYLEKGDISYNYTGTWYENDKAYIIENSKVQIELKNDMTGLIEIKKDTWRMVVNGKIIYDYTGLGENEYGIWYLKNGNISYAYNGTYTDKDGSVYVIENNKVIGTKLVEIDGTWKMVVNGKIVYDYTGIGQNQNGKWYLENGDISYNYTGTWYENDKAYIIENSKVQIELKKDMTGLVEIKKDTWRMIVNGRIIYDYTGLGENEYGIWYLENGNISYAYNGTYTDKDGSVYVIENNKVIGTKLVEIDGAWRMVIDGKIDYDYTGIGQNENGKWYLENGDISYNYTGTWYENDKAYIIEKNFVKIIVPKDTTKLIEIDNKWRMVVSGKVNYNYTGPAENENGRWYFEDGEITYTYNSEYEDIDGITYCIVNSKFSGIVSRPGYFGKMCLEQPVQGNGYISDSMIVSGWALSSEKDDKILLYIDGKYIAEISRESRQDILDKYSGEFGNEYDTKLPGFTYDLTQYGLSVGYHKIRIENVTADGGTIIQSREIEFTITALSKSYGIDVSHYQGEIDWVAVKNSGVTFAILKIGEYWTSSKKIVYDQFFERNYQACKRLGIAVGGYFYSYAFNRTEGNEEADICLSLIKNKIFELPIFIDVEDKAIKNAVANGKTDVANITDASLAFCEKMVNAGHQAGVYASRNFFYDYFNIPLIEKYWIWVAHYTSGQTDYTGKYDFWQCTSKGSVPGINGNVDLNWFYKK